MFIPIARRKAQKDQELLIVLKENFGKEVLNKSLFNIITYVPFEEEIEKIE